MVGQGRVWDPEAWGLVCNERRHRRKHTEIRGRDVFRWQTGSQAPHTHQIFLGHIRADQAGE